MSSLSTVAFFDFLLFFIILIAFNFLRSRNKFAYFFSPKSYSITSPVINNFESLPNSTGIFGFLWNSLVTSDDRMYDLRGMDALMHKVFLRTMILIFTSILPFACITFFVNGKGDQGQGGIMKFSLANIGAASDLMWLHVICVYAITMVVFLWILKAYKIFEAYSIEENTKDRAHNFTTLVRDVAYDDHPFRFGRSPSSRTVVSIQWAARAGKLRRLMRKRAKILQERKFMSDHYNTTGQVANGKEKWVAKLRKLDQQIASLPCPNDYMATSGHSAFLTHASISDAYASAMARESPKQVPAPCVNDVLWSSLSVSKVARAGLTSLAVILLFFLLFFWFVPVTFVQSIANLNHLSRVPGLSFLRSVQNIDPISLSFIEGFIPPLILIGFYALLPRLIRAVQRLRAPASYSRLDGHVAAAFFSFKVINVFLGSTFVGALFENLAAIKRGDGDGTPMNMLSILRLFGTSIPSQAEFFMTLILALACISYPLKLLRLDELIFALIKSRKACTSEERIFRQSPGKRYYSTWYGIELMVFTISMAFAVSAPLMVPMAVFFYLVAHIVSSYDAMYVAVPRNNGRGKQWHTSFNCLIAGLLLAQVTVISSLASKSFPSAAVLIGAPLITVAFCIGSKRRFNTRCDMLPTEGYSYSTSVKSGFRFSEAYADPVVDAKRANMTALENERAEAELELALPVESASAWSNMGYANV